MVAAVTNEMLQLSWFGVVGRVRCGRGRELSCALAASGTSRCLEMDLIGTVAKQQRDWALESGEARQKRRGWCERGQEEFRIGGDGVVLVADGRPYRRYRTAGWLVGWLAG